jgi:hypothetical protein
MPHIGKFTIVLVLAMVFGCVPKRGTASPEDYYAAVNLSLEGGRVAAMIGRNQALSEKNFAGCVVSDVLASALDSGQDALRGKLSEAPTIPAFELDLSECMAVRGDALPPGREEIASLVEGISGVALAAARHYAVKLKAADCRKAGMVLAVGDYVAGMLEPLVDEITEPDGQFSAGVVAIDLASCEAL